MSFDLKSFAQAIASKEAQSTETLFSAKISTRSKMSDETKAKMFAKRQENIAPLRLTHHLENPKAKNKSYLKKFTMSNKTLQELQLETFELNVIENAPLIAVVKDGGKYFANTKRNEKGKKARTFTSPALEKSLTVSGIFDSSVMKEGDHQYFEVVLIPEEIKQMILTGATPEEQENVVAIYEVKVKVLTDKEQKELKELSTKNEPAVAEEISAVANEVIDDTSDEDEDIDIDSDEDYTDEDEEEI